MMILIAGALLLLGVVLGSFAGAQVWRVRARQLRTDKQTGHPYDKHEWRQLRVLLQGTVRDDRSRCLQCGHVLAWYDLLPVVSWLSTGGRCRYCQQFIGWFELVMELVLGVGLALSYLVWPWALPASSLLFAVWVVVALVLMILAAYDTKWQLLPDPLNYGLMALGALFVLVRMTTLHDVDLVSLTGAVALLAGLYGGLYAISRGAWIGFGDVKLCVGLALLLGDWRLAFMTLFFSNMLGCIIVLPGLARGQLNTRSQVPFGPLLIIGCVISLLFGGYILRALVALPLGL
ncbi:prepilin peptidase [Candidatus Saccharibacteria bacterium]|nr:prepilin peptidase [Candidatus Saccharibacteria bacterium]